MFFKVCVIFAVLACAFGFRAQMKAEMPSFKKAIAAGVAGIFATGALNMPAHAISSSELRSLSYLQVKGTGLANRCPDVPAGEDGSISISGGKYKIVDMCIEPKSWQVEEVSTNKKGETVKEFVNTKLMTRQTYSLADVEGTLESQGGKLVFSEKDGIDYAATTVQTPGGERVPLLFSVKNLVATGNGDKIKPGFEMGGSFTVPSYRTGLFLDPKGRGTTTGYDMAVALPGIQGGLEGDKELFKENNKRFEVLKGDIEFAVQHVNAEDGEFDGVFVSNQPSDTDMGAKVPKNILLKGIFYGRVEKQ